MNISNFRSLFSKERGYINLLFLYFFIFFFLFFFNPVEFFCFFFSFCEFHGNQSIKLILHNVTFVTVNNMVALAECIIQNIFNVRIPLSFMEFGRLLFSVEFVSLLLSFRQFFCNEFINIVKLITTCIIFSGCGFLFG